MVEHLLAAVDRVLDGRREVAKELLANLRRHWFVDDTDKLYTLCEKVRLAPASGAHCAGLWLPLTSVCSQAAKGIFGPLQIADIATVLCNYMLTCPQLVNERLGAAALAARGDASLGGAAASGDVAATFAACLAEPVGAARGRGRARRTPRGARGGRPVAASSALPDVDAHDVVETHSNPADAALAMMGQHRADAESSASSESSSESSVGTQAGAGLVRDRRAPSARGGARAPQRARGGSAPRGAARVAAAPRRADTPRLVPLTRLSDLLAHFITRVLRKCLLVDSFSQGRTWADVPSVIRRMVPRYTGVPTRPDFFKDVRMVAATLDPAVTEDAIAASAEDAHQCLSVLVPEVKKARRELISRVLLDVMTKALAGRPRTDSSLEACVQNAAASFVCCDVPKSADLFEDACEIAKEMLPLNGEELSEEVTTQITEVLARQRDGFMQRWRVTCMASVDRVLVDGRDPCHVGRAAAGGSAAARGASEVALDGGAAAAAAAAFGAACAATPVREADPEVLGSADGARKRGQDVCGSAASGSAEKRARATQSVLPARRGSPDGTWAVGSNSSSPTPPPRPATGDPVHDGAEDAQVPAQPPAAPRDAGAK